MKKIEQILKHPLFRASMAQIELLERERVFCRHGMEHGLAVARVAWIMSLEEKLRFSKELIYAAALLHDIGRWKQYTEGAQHEAVSAGLAQEILADTDFSTEEIGHILAAIECHRSQAVSEKDSFTALMYRADKQSRPCYLCAAREDCYWPEERKNRSIFS